MLTRRLFLKGMGMTGAGLFLTMRGDVPRIFAAPLVNGVTLDPATIPKYGTPLVIPPSMPQTSMIKVKGGKNIDYYEIAVRQFQQQILPAGWPKTTVWGYGSVNHPSTFNYPAFTLEAKWRSAVRVKWINELKDASGNYLPHLLPVDQTLHWANPPGGIMHRDHEGHDPAPYTGPVPLVTHVHGAHTTDESDGYAEAWYLPNAVNIPAGYARTGTWYDTFKNEFFLEKGVRWSTGSAIFQYPNDQAAATLWYHDHTLGMTRSNVYAGPAGFYLIRGGPGDAVGGVLPGPAAKYGDNPNKKYFEIPIAIQDRAFKLDGSLFYPNTREFFDGFAGPYKPDMSSDVSPIWNPEFFGDTMVVNGKTWPSLKVEPRRYRFRLLNGCNSRFLILKMVTNATVRPGVPALPFWQIGAEGGFLPAPVQLNQLLMSPAERADVIVDFTGLPVGTEIFLINEGPDEPFGGGIAGTDFPFADPNSTGQVMKFKITALTGADGTTPPALLTLPAKTPLGLPSVTRQVSLNEATSALPFGGPIAALLGTVDNPGPGASGNPLKWDLGINPITENPAVGATEVWEIYNFTVDAHPIHIHEVQFEVVNREIIGGAARLPETWEAGFKDTVIAYPGEITRIKARFDYPGLFVWHCHIVEHEDNEMMRSFTVGPMPTLIIVPNP